MEMMTMRDYKKSSSCLFEDIEKTILRFHKEISLLSTPVAVSPMLNMDDFTNRFVLPKGKNNIIRIIMMAHFGIFTEEIAFLIKIQLQETNFREEDDFLIDYLSNIMLTPEFDIWLIEQRIYHWRDFNGNILNVKLMIYYYNKILNSSRRDKSKVKKPVFRRGYNDKGSRRPDSKWFEKDFTPYSEREQLELTRLTLANSAKVITGFIT